jgi:hypothetical protein
MVTLKVKEVCIKGVLNTGSDVSHQRTVSRLCVFLEFENLAAKGPTGQRLSLSLVCLFTPVLLELEPGSTPAETSHRRE